MTPADWRGWAVLSLHDYAEHLPVEEVARDLKRHLPRGRFFFPAVRHGAIEPTSPLAAYVFVMANHADRTLMALQRSRFVEHVLCMPRTRRVTRLTDPELRRMVEPPQVVYKRGQWVTITVGDYGGMDGKVVTVLARRVRVRLTLWSRTLEVLIPRAEVVHRA